MLIPSAPLVPLLVFTGWRLIPYWERETPKRNQSGHPATPHMLCRHTSASIKVIKGGLLEATSRAGKKAAGVVAVQSSGRKAAGEAHLSRKIVLLVPQTRDEYSA